jgi:hypothetical protein
MSLVTDRTGFQRVFQQVNSASASLTPGTLTANTVNTSNTIACPGAAIGDIVDVSAPASLGGIMMQGEVTAANVVTIKFLSAATTAPSAGVYKVATYSFTSEVV